MTPADRNRQRAKVLHQAVMGGLGDLHVDEAADTLEQLLALLDEEHADLVLESVPADDEGC